MMACEELTRKLDALHWPVTASMWFYFPEENQWRLLLASPAVSKEGPMKAYQNVQEAIKNLPKRVPKLALQDITVIEDTHSLISLMRIAIRTGEEISGIRFSKNTISGHLIEDAYIYRLL